MAARFARRRVAVAALATLAALSGLAVYAPILSSAEPLVLVAADAGAVRRSASSLPVLAREVERAVATRRSTGARDGSVDRALSAVELRAATLAFYLAPDAASAARARALERELDECRDALLAIDLARLEAAAAALVEIAGAIGDAAPASAGELVQRRTFPALAELRRADVLAMALWPFAVAWPLVRRAIRSRAARVALPLGIASALALAWPAVFPRAPGLPATPAKAGLASGDLLAASARFAPVPYGFAEQNLSEPWRAPTWLAAAEVDADGRAVRGEQRAPLAQPVEVRPGESPRNSAWRHPFGTDGLGRDVFARTLHGARVSLGVGAAAAALMVALGALIGATAGYFGGAVDFALSRALEVVQCFPSLVLVLVAAALIPAGTLPPAAAIALIVGCVGWTGIARLARAEFLRLVALDFVASARALGLSGARIAVQHVLPNALGPILVAGTFAVATGILSESAISFLGFGVEKPVPSWGSLLDESRGFTHWWLQIFPGAAIFTALVSCHLVGEALRDALDPRSGP